MFAERLLEVQKIAARVETHWSLRHSPLLPWLAHRADELKDELIPSQSFFQCLDRNEIRGSLSGGYKRFYLLGV
jgi:hypothetical protein